MLKLSTGSVRAPIEKLDLNVMLGCSPPKTRIAVTFRGLHAAGRLAAPYLRRDASGQAFLVPSASGFHRLSSLGPGGAFEPCRPEPCGRPFNIETGVMFDMTPVCHKKPSFAGYD
jgi:hypothetical protein